MLRRKLVLLVAALILAVASLGTLYAFQQKPAVHRPGRTLATAPGAASRAES